MRSRERLTQSRNSSVLAQASFAAAAAEGIGEPLGKEITDLPEQLLRLQRPRRDQVVQLRVMSQDGRANRAKPITTTAIMWVA